MPDAPKSNAGFTKGLLVGLIAGLLLFMLGFELAGGRDKSPDPKPDAATTPPATSAPIPPPPPEPAGPEARPSNRRDNSPRPPIAALRETRSMLAGPAMAVAGRFAQISANPTNIPDEIIGTPFLFRANELRANLTDTINQLRDNSFPRDSRRGAGVSVFGMRAIPVGSDPTEAQKWLDMEFQRRGLQQLWDHGRTLHQPWLVRLDLGYRAGGDVISGVMYLLIALDNSGDGPSEGWTEFCRPNDCSEIEETCVPRVRGLNVSQLSGVDRCEDVQLIEWTLSGRLVTDNNPLRSDCYWDLECTLLATVSDWGSSGLLMEVKCVCM